MLKNVSLLLLAFLAIGGIQLAVNKGVLDFQAHPIRVLGEDEVLYQIRQVVADGERLFVLTAPEPALHRFEGKNYGTYTSWGKQGQGPGELESPVSFTLQDDRVLVLDSKTGNSKIVVYDLEGGVIETRSVREPQLVGQLYLLDDRLLIEGGDYGKPGSEVVDAKTGEVVLEVEGSEAGSITLQAVGAPSVTVSRPGASKPRWAPLDAARYALWDARSDAIEIRRFRDHQTIDTMKLPSERVPFRPADRERWIENALPKVQIAGHQDPFRKLREAAIDQVEFPKFFAPVLRMKADAVEGVWIHRGWGEMGPIWSWLRSGREPVTVVFPTDREPLLFGPDIVVLKALDDLGVETLEIFRRSDIVAPKPAGQAAS